MKNFVNFSPLSALFAFVLVFLALLVPLPTAKASVLPAQTILKEDVAKAKHFYQVAQETQAESTNLIVSNLFQTTCVDCTLMKRASTTSRQVNHYTKLAKTLFQKTCFRRARDGLLCDNPNAVWRKHN